MTRITGVRTLDVRAPTSRTLAGSDAVHTDPDYSGAYVFLETDGEHEGVGMTFTIGAGNDLCCAAIEQLAPLLVGRDVEELIADSAGMWRRLTNHSQLRWLGPEKGVIHLATAALVNAVWDLSAKEAGVPLWHLLADLTPEAFVDLVDFRYLTDVLDRDEALDLVRELAPTRAGACRRAAARRVSRVPHVGGLARVPGGQGARTRRRAALADGWRCFKTKVGVDVASDVRRCELMREEIGDLPLMADANQVWDVGQAIEWMRHLEPFGLRWIEEPTSPDDVLGHAAIRRAVAPVGVATGEHAMNRVVFKQLLQAEAIDYCQIDACRLGGVNEVIAVLLLAAKFDVPVCPHAGGLALCEYVQHLSIVDYVCVSGSLDDRTTEFADHLHEHFRASRARARRPLPGARGTGVLRGPAPGVATTRSRIRAARSGGDAPDRAARSARRRGHAASGWAARPLGNMFTALDEDVADATVAAAWDAGIRCFDTAPFYGHGLAEERLGRVLRGHPRDEFVLSSKVGRLLDPDADFDPGIFRVPRGLAPRFDYSRDGVLRSIDDSLGPPRTRPPRRRARPRSRRSRAGGARGRVPRAARAAGPGRGAGDRRGMNQHEMLARFVARVDLDCVLLAGRYTLLDRTGAALLDDVRGAGCRRAARRGVQQRHPRRRRVATRRSTTSPRRTRSSIAPRRLRCGLRSARGAARRPPRSTSRCGIRP